MRMRAKQSGLQREGGSGWFRGLGYLVYTLVAAVIALWLLFPARNVQQYLMHALERLAPGTQWQVGRVELRLPLILRVQEVVGSLGNTEAPPVQIDQLEIWPDWNASLREHTLWVNYQLRLGPGALRGRISRQEQRYRFYGKAQGLQLESVALLARLLGRKLQGRISAVYEGSLCPATQGASSWKVQATLENGRLSLLRPLLHHTEVVFTQASMLLRGQGREITISEGRLDSPLGKGWFNGRLRMMPDPLQSQLKLRGGFSPQPAFFAGLENTVALQSVRLELQDKPLPVSLSGTLLHPGVHFEGLAMQMYALEREIR